MQKYTIIGGGILGASTAYHLSKEGAEVVIIDRSDVGQATDASAGIVCPWLSQRRNKAWYTLAKNGASYYPELISQLEAEGQKETGYKQVGAISIRKEEKKLIDMEKRAIKRKQDAPEIGDIKILSPSETKKLFPPLTEGYGAVYVSGAARVDGRLLRDALLQAAINNGATCINGSALIEDSDSTSVKVKVNDQTIDTEIVIVTAGAWVRTLLKPIGINLMIKPQKGQIVHLHLPNQDTSNWPVVMPPSDQYLLAFDESRIIAGATHEDEAGFDSRVTPIGLKEVFDKALQFAPGLAQSTLIETRVGFRPVAPGFLPIIGPLPNHKNILVANGLGSSGLTMGPYIGMQLAKLALGKEVDIDLDDYPVSGAIEEI